MSFGLAGTDPIADLTARVNVLLMNAVKTKWNQTVHGTSYDPPPAPQPYPLDTDIYWLPTWTTGSKDIQLIFKEEFTDLPSQLRTTDWRLQGYVSTVNIHVFVRGDSKDQEPVILGTIIRGIEKVIAIHKTSLIAKAWCEVTGVLQGPQDRTDALQTHWHHIVRVRVHYFKIVIS